MTAQEQLAGLTGALQQLRSNTLGISDFAHLARQPTELLAALPEKYAEVLHHVLDRIESSALFAEESCSFSQKELLDSLDIWLDKARLQLDKTSV